MTVKKWVTLLVTALAAVFVLTACSGSSEKKTSSSDSSAISSMPKIDGVKYYGDVPKNPKKVVNFAYSYTGYLLQLGVNVSSYSLDAEKNSPAFGEQLKDAVQLTADDTEAIAAQEPDLIIVFAGSDNIDKLKEIAPVIEVTYGKSDYLQMLDDLAAIFGKEDKAKEWRKTWDKKVENAKKELSSYVSSDTTFTVMDFYDKNITIYGNNFGRGGELIYDALGYSAPQTVQDEVINKDGWLSISQETLGNYVGDYLVMDVNKDSSESAASLKESDVYKNLPAVQNGKALELDYDLFYFSDPMSLDKQIDAFVDAVKKVNQ
ncbi:ABC transporter substrate-binding protein [Streptococcus dentiloxodontae]